MKELRDKINVNERSSLSVSDNDIPGLITNRLFQKARRIYHSLFRPPSTNYDLKRMRHDPYAMLPEGAFVLDIGSKSARGQYSFKSRPENVRVLTLDIETFNGVNVAGDAHHLPFRSESVHCVMLVSVLMYITHPEKAIAEVLRVLQPGGVLYVSSPFVFRLAPAPDDYYRFSVNGLRVLCQSFDEIESGFNRGPASTMSDLLVHFFAILFCFNRKRLYGILLDIFGWCFFWVKYFDQWIGNYSVAKVIHNGAFFLGRKPAARR